MMIQKMEMMDKVEIKNNKDKQDLQQKNLELQVKRIEFM